MVDERVMTIWRRSSADLHFLKRTSVHGPYSLYLPGRSNGEAPIKVHLHPNHVIHCEVCDEATAFLRLNDVHTPLNVGPLSSLNARPIPSHGPVQGSSEEGGRVPLINGRIQINSSTSSLCCDHSYGEVSLWGWTLQHPCTSNNRHPCWWAQACTLSAGWDDMT
jgi:hypothetical protein